MKQIIILVFAVYSFIALGYLAWAVRDIQIQVKKEPPPPAPLAEARPLVLPSVCLKLPDKETCLQP